jgi:hypothetical protein
MMFLHLTVGVKKDTSIQADHSKQKFLCTEYLYYTPNHSTLLLLSRVSVFYSAQLSA